jgi:hypothetical protein
MGIYEEERRGKEEKQRQGVKSRENYPRNTSGLKFGSFSFLGSSGVQLFKNKNIKI